MMDCTYVIAVLPEKFAFETSLKCAMVYFCVVNCADTAFDTSFDVSTAIALWMFSKYTCIA